MRYLLRHRAPQKVFFLVPVHRRDVACSVGRKDKVLGSLHNWNAVRKAEALPGPPVQERTCREKPPVKRHCWDSNPGSPVYKTGALTSYATVPCWIQLFFGSSWGWFANQIASGTGAPLHHWRFSAPPFAFRSRIEKPLSPRWCSSTPSKGTAGNRTQDLLFTRQAFWPVMPRRPAGSSILWQQLRGGLQTKSPAALALLCTPVCIPFSDKKKPLSPRWCSSSPSKGTAGIRTQDLLFTKQAL